MGDMMGAMWLVGLLWFVALLGGVALIIWMIQRGRREETVGIAPGVDRALTLLRERFARGEMTADEYRQTRTTLDDRPH